MSIEKLVRQAYRIGFNDGILNRKPNEFNKEMVLLLQEIEQIYTKDTEDDEFPLYSIHPMPVSLIEEIDTMLKKPIDFRPFLQIFNPKE